MFIVTQVYSWIFIKCFKYTSLTPYTAPGVTNVPELQQYWVGVWSLQGGDDHTQPAVHLQSP